MSAHVKRFKLSLLGWGWRGASENQPKTINYFEVAAFYPSCPIIFFKRVGITRTPWHFMEYLFGEYEQGLNVLKSPLRTRGSKLKNVLFYTIRSFARTSLRERGWERWIGLNSITTRIECTRDRPHSRWSFPLRPSLVKNNGTINSCTNCLAGILAEV